MRKIYISFILLISLFTSCKNTGEMILVKFQGEAQGTYYSISYFEKSGENYHDDIDKLLKDFDQTASIWEPQSLISQVNNNGGDVALNQAFIDLFNMSKLVYEQSTGAFDPTIGPMVNAWGFGFTDRMKVDQQIVDSILEFIGFDKVSLEGGSIIKEDSRMQFDFNAIAQGYSVNLIADFLEQKGVKSYLVDIGGEMIAKGIKPDGNPWKVGIEKPTDNAEYGEKLKAIITLKNKAIATSGNYRKFYEEDGIRYSHTIDPKTGYPVQHSILSVSVVAENCALADAWATAFMVLGFDQSIEILGRDKNLDAYFIYSGSTSGDLKTYFTEGFKEILIEELE